MPATKQVKVGDEFDLKVMVAGNLDGISATPNKKRRFVVEELPIELRNFEELP